MVMITAFRDHCQIVGGLTALHRTQDCAGESRWMARLDCAEVCGGTAYVDNCDICVGGTTGLDLRTGLCGGLGVELLKIV